MKLLVAVFSFLCTGVLFSQGNIDSLHFNYLNTSLSITDTEQSLFWDRYVEMEQQKTGVITSQREMKKSLMYAFAKSDDEIKSIIDCVDILDAERAIKFSIYEKKFKKMAKVDNSK
jgi:hypothetical protein